MSLKTPIRKVVAMVSDRKLMTYELCVVIGRFEAGPKTLCQESGIFISS
jgi:hypothetical protein